MWRGKKFEKFQKFEKFEKFEKLTKNGRLAMKQEQYSNIACSQLMQLYHKNLLTYYY